MSEQSHRHRIAVIDDEAIVCREISRGLAKEGYEVESFGDGESALKAIRQHPADVVVCDLRLPGIGGMEVLRALQEHSPQTEVIIATGFSSVDSAIDAIRAGAYHYITKPVKMAELKLLVARALDKVALVREREVLREALLTQHHPFGMLGSSVAMQKIFRLVDKVGPLDCTVLLQGESGTGKEMVARALHEAGPRREGPFVSFNCGGFTEELIANELFGHEQGAFTGATRGKPGLLETANGGTILLDEIEDMPISMQTKLLRFTEERRVTRVGGVKPIPLDVRLIAAGNQDLKELVKRQVFREDLYYRLNVVVITLPPLRERKGDIPLLIGHFLRKYSCAFAKEVRGASPQALELLTQHHYPGNVRELENAIERAVALAEGHEIGADDLPQDIRGTALQAGELGHWPSLEDHEKTYIRRVLHHTGNRRAEAAALLEIPRTTLWRKMKRYGLV
jgi:DNA-binding NtrC family response regulator